MFTIHKNIKKLISAYHDAEVTEKEKQLVEEHLKTCKECREYLDSLKKVSQKLKDWREEIITPDLEQKIKTNFLSDKYKKAKVKTGVKTLIAVGTSSGVIVAILTAFLGTQIYLKQGLQGRIKESSDQLGQQFSPGTSQTVSKVQSQSNQYEPYYLSAAYDKSSSAYKFAKTEALQVGGGITRDAFSGSVSARTDSMGVSCWSTQAVPQEEFNTESYDRIYENDFLEAINNPLSTFSIDVDTASYSNVRRFLNESVLPPKDAVRIEEMINYFKYDYPQPQDAVPFSITTEISVCPWNDKHKMLLIGLQGRKIDAAKLPPSNVVFLIDVSGSMNYPDKLPLLKSAFRLLVNELRKEDKVSIVTYAGTSGVLIDSISGENKDRILSAIDSLQSGGSTAGGAGIKMAYEIAKKNFVKDGNNRVILATDGDFNVGASSNADMERLIEEKREDGIFLTVLGFGQGNYKDSRMEILADKGNGNAFYIDNLLEAKKVFVDDLTSTILTIAKDVKIQIEFNPAKVKSYRLVGYENRMLKKEDFNDDKKDAGEMGAGHSVTALYEIIPLGSIEEHAKVDDLNYQKITVTPSEDLATVKLRYKEPDGDQSKLIVKKIAENDETIDVSNNFKFATSVAEFGLILRDSEYKANASYTDVLERAKASKGKDDNGYRAEFIKLVELAQMLNR